MVVEAGMVVEATAKRERASFREALLTVQPQAWVFLSDPQEWPFSDARDDYRRDSPAPTRKRSSTTRQLTLAKNASMYFGRSASL